MSCFRHCTERFHMKVKRLGSCNLEETAVTLLVMWSAGMRKIYPVLKTTANVLLCYKYYNYYHDHHYHHHHHRDHYSYHYHDQYHHRYHHHYYSTKHVRVFPGETKSSQVLTQDLRLSFFCYLHWGTLTITTAVQPGRQKTKSLSVKQQLIPPKREKECLANCFQSKIC